jgi:hypothetical protein
VTTANTVLYKPGIGRILAALAISQIVAVFAVNTFVAKLAFYAHQKIHADLGVENIVGIITIFIEISFENKITIFGTSNLVYEITVLQLEDTA